ncbi:MAG: hypothetical protein J7647_21975 [Cyanobacteria bacterium SBLK]|nr:hypothetical protein [Cyanobacteria bacterium SBLK]
MSGLYPQQESLCCESVEAQEALEPYRFIDTTTGRYLNSYRSGVRLGVVQRRCAAGEMSSTAVSGKMSVESAAALGLNVTDNGASANPRYTRTETPQKGEELTFVADDTLDLGFTNAAVISVQSQDLQTPYALGADYTVVNGVITRVGAGAIAAEATVFVTYTTGTDKYLKVVADGKVDLAKSGEIAIAVLDRLSDWAAPASVGMQLVTIALLLEPHTVS